ncbi:MAG: chemotaxis protein CheW [Candidatus Goldbacteria bacterium]|nr:chemotaxis protein CheW [Candidatus Goldiibacteriota bacterium]
MNILKQQQKTLGELLINSGIINKEQLEIALNEQKNTDEPLGKILVRMGFAREEDIINVLKGMLVVIFEINNESFGVEIIFAKEIIKYKKIIPLPTVSKYIKGLISIRDIVVPVISLNQIIYNKEDVVTEDTRIIVIENKDDVAGILVDKVVAVKNFHTGDFEKLSNNSVNAEKKYIAGIIKDKNGIITLIKPEFIFSGKIYV